MRLMLILLLVMMRETFLPFASHSLTVVARAPLLLSRAAFLSTALFRVARFTVIDTLLSTLPLMMSSNLRRLISSEFGSNWSDVVLTLSSHQALTQLLGGKLFLAPVKDNVQVCACIEGHVVCRSFSVEST